MSTNKCEFLVFNIIWTVFPVEVSTFLLQRHTVISIPSKINDCILVINQNQMMTNDVAYYPMYCIYYSILFT